MNLRFIGQPFLTSPSIGEFLNDALQAPGPKSIWVLDMGQRRVQPARVDVDAGWVTGEIGAFEDGDADAIGVPLMPPASGAILQRRRSNA